MRHSNSGSTQKIYAKGLSQTKGTAGSGELYISDNLLSAFDTLISTLKNIVDGVRSVGNNNSNSTTWKTQLDNVNALIKESGIIANS